MPAHQKSPLRIFISSPGDVAAERDRAEAVIRKVDADLEHIDLEVVRWEGRPYSAVSTFQTQIDKPSDCDLVVCIFWKRLGTYLPPEFDRPDGSARTGTQYEFEDALEAARSRPDKVPDMFVYRSKAPVTFSEATVAKEQAEKQALEEFWLRWMQNPEGQFLAAFKYYAGADAFAREFERDLRDWLAARDRGGDWSIATSGSPFVGLKAFDEKYASVFFGRRRVTDRLRAALMAAAQLGFPSVFVLGASGIGKSSLCRAGLIPRLMVHGATEPLIDVWRRLVVTPTELGPDLIAGFSRALVVDDVLKEILAGDCRASDQLTALLGSGPSQAVIPVIAALDRFAADVKQKGGFETDPITGLVVVIDQFEELLLAHDDEQRHGFLALLTALAETGRVWLVFTLRTDFYPALQADPPSLALKKRGQVFDVVAPGGAEIRDMIEGPARASGLSYEKSGQRDLAELLEREAAQPGALPMLQYALQALFEAREDEILTLTEYDRLGGAAGALAKKAEDAFSRLDPAAQEAFPRVLGALASFDLAGERVSPAARAANLSQFRPDTPERRLVDMLLGERLLIAFGESGSTESAPPTVRIVHESLFERWPRAADQLATDRQDLDRRTQLERAEKDYQAALAAAGPKAAKDHLLTGIHLTNARDLRQRRPDLLAPTVIAFVDDSYRQARAKQKRLRTLEVSGAALLAGLAAAAFFFASDAEVKRREAQASLETAQQTIGGVLKTLEGPRMERVWGFVDIEGDLMRRLAELQARLPQGKWESQDRAIALTNVRLGLAHERKAEITEAVSKFEEAYTKALPL
ncbi:MAG TPA: AAA family ATPase, partial [Defluviicoccus sp.]|nr:AAA family ATPase [Defluviicoccus sp.]